MLNSLVHKIQKKNINHEYPSKGVKVKSLAPAMNLLTCLKSSINFVTSKVRRDFIRKMSRHFIMTSLLYVFHSRVVRVPLDDGHGGEQHFIAH